MENPSVVYSTNYSHFYPTDYIRSDATDSKTSKFKDYITSWIPQIETQLLKTVDKKELYNFLS